MEQTLNKNDLEKLYQQLPSIATQKAKAACNYYFGHHDLPTLKDEEWRKTDLKHLTNHQFELAEKVETDIHLVSKFNISGSKANILVFMNGFYVPEASKIFDINEIEIIDSIKSHSKTEIFEKYYDRSEIHSLHYFTAMNTAFAADGAMIVIKKNAEVKNPIHIYNFSDGKNRKITFLQRNLFIAQQGSKSSLVMSFHALSDDVFLTNVATEIFLDNNSTVDLNIFEGEGNNAYLFNAVKVQQNPDSNFSAHTYTMCGRLVRNDLHIDIMGENCNTELNGLYLPDREQHVDNNIFVNHKIGHSQSFQFYRGILDNNATAIFSSKVHIEKFAVKTNANQKNNNILLSKHAKVHSKPQLIIDNDDVAASHGSTVGQLNKEALFYMQSRGISYETAQTLLLTAFANEISEKIKLDSFRNYITYYIEKRLQGEKIEGLCSKMGICRG